MQAKIALIRKLVGHMRQHGHHTCRLRSSCGICASASKLTANALAGGVGALRRVSSSTMCHARSPACYSAWYSDMCTALYRMGQWDIVMWMPHAVDGLQRERMPGDSVRV